MGIFRNDGPTPTACPALPTPVTDAAPIAGSLTFDQLSHWISGISMGVASIIAIGLILMHATHMSRPEEQIRIIRIVGLIPAFGLLAFGATYLNQDAIYLMAWLHPCESIAMASFFQLVCVFGQPRPGAIPPGQNGGFEQLPPRPKDGPLHPIFPSASMQIRVFQYVPVSIAVAALSCILQAAGKYCFNSNDIHFGHIWLQIVQALSVAIAVMTTIRFTSMHKSAIPQHSPMKKLFAFKGLIFLDFIQTLVFSFAAGKFTPSDKFAYTDLTANLPSIILNIEVFIFSIVFFFVYSYRPYAYRGSNNRYNGGLGALIHAFNPFSVIKDLLTPYY